MATRILIIPAIISRSILTNSLHVSSQYEFFYAPNSICQSTHVLPARQQLEVFICKGHCLRRLDANNGVFLSWIEFRNRVDHLIAALFCLPQESFGYLHPSTSNYWQYLCPQTGHIENIQGGQSDFWIKIFGERIGKE